MYKPGNVKLHPELLGKHQAFVREKSGSKEEKPVFLVFHGGSGSSVEEFRTAIGYGVVKVNLGSYLMPSPLFPLSGHSSTNTPPDTDLQWAYLTGIRDFIINNIDYLRTQVGNPEGADKPNKKKYDPRVWVREGEKTMTTRIKQAFEEFLSAGAL